MIFETLFDSLSQFSNLGDSLSKVDGILASGMRGMTGYKNQIISLASATEGLDAKNTLLVLSQKGISAQTAQNVLKAKNLTKEQIYQAMSTYTVAGSQKMATGTTISLSNAYKGLAASIGISTTALTTFIGVAAGITVAVVAINTLYDTVEETAEKAKAAAESLDSMNDTTTSNSKTLKSLSELNDAPFLAGHSTKFTDDSAIRSYVRIMV